MALQPAAREPVQKPPTPRLFGILLSLMSSWIGQRHESAIAAFLAGIGEKRTIFATGASNARQALVFLRTAMNYGFGWNL